VLCCSSVGVNPHISTRLSSSVAVPSVDSSVVGTGNYDSSLDQTLYASALDRRKSDASPISADLAARLADLEHENDILRRQLEKIGKLDGLAMERSSRPPSRDRRGSSTSRNGSTGGRKETERLKSENLELIDRLRDVEDEAQALKQERESLLLTIQLLQDDLTSSERQRQRGTPTST
jgi:predicted  nucleic acid-binding Zn-ribbon protein